MSNRWFYEVDGRIGGPITPMQLQLMVNSGMLQPHHKIRKENMTAWSPASSVRGLFPDAPATPPSGVQAAAVMPNPATPAAATAPAPAGSAPSEDNAFDFFSDPPPPPATPATEPTRTNKGTAAVRDKAPEPAPAEAPPPAVPENPFGFLEVSASPAGSAALMSLEQPAVGGSSQREGAASRSGEQVSGTPIPAQAPEVTGTAVELLPDDTVRILQGQTNLRLYRAWLQAVTKFADGTARSVYLRLQRLDGAILEHRYESGRGNRPPHAVLSFQAGELTVGLVFQGSDKPYRAFVEKVLLQSNMSKSPPAKG